MCGICCVIYRSYNEDRKPTLEYVQHNSRLFNRGPDCVGSCEGKLSSSHHALFCGCVLHFRGSLTPQPMCNEEGDILLWNGEIFGGFNLKKSENDGAVLLKTLSLCDDDPSLLRVIATIQGPWAFIYWQKSCQKLWFGRDIFGRRCLLWGTGTSSQCDLALSSVRLHPYDMSEVPATGVYCMDFNTTSCTDVMTITKYPWQFSGPSNERVFLCQERNSLANDELCANNISVSLGQYCLWPGISEFNRTLPVELCDDIESSCGDDSGKKSDASLNGSTVANDIELLQSLASARMQELSTRLITVLGQSVRVRVEALPDVCGKCLHTHIKENRSSNDRSAVDSNHPEKPPQICHLNGIERKLDEAEITSNSSDNCSAALVAPSVDQLEERSICSADCRVSSHLPLCDDGSDGCSSFVECGGKVLVKGCGHSRIGILFSGGIDCMVLAALADRYVPHTESIDLLNVAFEQRRPTTGKGCKASRNGSEPDTYSVPDRVTGRNGVKELNPDRKWNFVEINIPLDELQSARQEDVVNLVYPLNTVLDDSIGCAVWFASRGRGLVNGQPYTTTARVVLVGMGADEQFGGYSRHRGRFGQEGWQGLVDEIDMEIKRISARNLGRDDRVISDHGREARFPYLDEDVVSFLNALHISEKVDLTLPRGVGEKLLLRLTASQLGLKCAAVLPKRAIQFGSRIAKAENRKEKAGDVCARLVEAKS